MRKFHWCMNSEREGWLPRTLQHTHCSGASAPAIKAFRHVCTHSQGWGAVTHFFPPPLCLAILILVCTVSFFLLFSSSWPHLPLAGGGSVALRAIFMPSCTHRICGKNSSPPFIFPHPVASKANSSWVHPGGGPVIFSTNFRAFHLWLALINFLASCLVHLWKYSPYGCDPFL